jgi:PAS domain S-box-containing protein
MSEWQPAPVPPDEHVRLRRLERLGLREGQRHEVLDHITALAADLVEVPIALVSIVTSDRQVFASRFGLGPTSTGRPESFCGHAIHDRHPFEVPDAHADPRFAANPLVLGAPHLRAYLGTPLWSDPGQSALGTLCVIDRKPRAWSDRDRDRLAYLAAMVEYYLESLVYRRAWDDSPLSLVILDTRGHCVLASPALARLTGRSLAMLRDQPLATTVIPADRGVLTAMLNHTFEHHQSPTRRELRFVRLSGEVVSGGVSMSPMAEYAGHVICVIRDISLERRSTARSGVVAEVRTELGQPLAEARALVTALRGDPPGASPGDASAAALAQLERRLSSLDELLDARMGDIGGRVQAEEALRASEARLRAVVEHALDLLLVIDDRGRIVDANALALTALGWSYDSLVGSSLRVVLPEFSEAQCRRWFEASAALAGRAAQPLRLPEAQGTLVTRAGDELRVDLRWIAMDWNGPGRLVVLAHDVTAASRRQDRLEQERDDLEERVNMRTLALAELQRMEAELKQSLAEKETLLKEIHHRVKNNLQIVSSLLTLQAEHMPSPEARALITESVQRVRSMALIHQLLYGSTSLERIDIAAYARTLTESLRHVLCPHARVQLELRSVEVSVETAVPVGLILNELITNAFKYGVVPGAPGDHDVVVEVGEVESQLRVMVRDFGPGLPEGFRIERGTSLGLQLVRSLTRQVRGSIEARSGGGARFELRCNA